MSEIPEPITVYGATGYTGKLVAAELARREAPFIVAGRNREKLEALADSLGDHGPKPEVHAVPNTDSRGMKELFSRSAAVIACAGPFSLHGEPVLAAAVEAGVPYLDTTGEQDFIRRAFEVYGPRATKAGCPVLPAMGFDYVPGDMLAALTAAGLDEGESVDKVRLAYHAPFQPSRGTMRSAIEMIKGGDVEWRERALRPASQAVARPDFDFGGRLGVQKMMHYPAAEHITVPTHLAPRTVETGLTVSSFAPGTAGQVLLPPINRALGLAMRTPLRKAMSGAISAMPEGADEKSRTASEFTVACDVTSARMNVRGTLTGTDVYGLTAALITEGAIRCARGEVGGNGALAPATAFEPAGFLAGFGRFKLDWEITAAR
ncbi:MAG: saccharopine dehydrogenase NADP-binding domain-containing protein [Solirubrobacterales bacterium]|nr:saccharopine dehydrogenase NADP-binding domain-containing protein [Solirubrobacterales bacterium]MCB0859720.1 saccharopine dehydrogenase NADP-binding domain-containing protein [Solirubrobacterales bacterium]